MPDLPSGTITFLFTDIEGSTALWEQQPQTMRRALARHDALVEELVTQGGGVVVRPRGEGDSRFAVFVRATDALGVTAALQQAFYSEPWPTPTPLRVRIALHTGEADLRQGDYYGSAVNRCARLRAVAHGGQTVVSLATAELARDALPAAVGLRDLGEHFLRDLQQPEQIFQLVIPGLPDDFPPLRTLDNRPNNLLIQRYPLIGRKREVAAVEALLQRADVGLVTLTGPGGTGKTRLALQVAADLLDAIADGVFFVALAPVTDPALVIPSIAQALGVHEAPAQPLLGSLKVHLGGKQLLLVLDNFEQVIDAAPVVADLLAAAPNLKVLVTSREVLHLYGEHEFPVPPLTLPDRHHLPDLQSLSQYDSIQLFIERAQVVQPDFAITDATAPAVAEICHRLDGLPLAIELAAARIRLLSPRAMLQRLDHRLKMLTGGARDLPVRHQTLRSTIDWSYNLLSPGEQVLLARLAVFVGGWTLEAAEAVCDADGGLPVDTLESLESLVAKSLVRRQTEGASGEDSAPRFGLLETIREYALERLEASGEAVALSTQHLVFFRELTEAAEPHLKRSEREHWLNRLDEELPNLRSALEWALTSDTAAEGLRLVVAPITFWVMRGHDREAYQWLERLTAMDSAIPGAIKARALAEGALFPWLFGDYTKAQAWCEEAVPLCRLASDWRSLSSALQYLGLMEPDRDRQVQLLQEAVRAARQAGDSWDLAMKLWRLGDAYAWHDPERAQALYAESLTGLRQLSDQGLMGWVLMSMGELARRQGNYDQAATWLEEALVRTTAEGHSAGIASSLEALGHVALDRGDYGRAATLLDEALDRTREAGHRHNFAGLVCMRGRVALAQDDVTHATTLAGEGLHLAQTIGDKPGLALALHLLGRIAQRQGDLARASALLAESLSYRQDAARYDVPESLEGLASLATTRAAQEANGQQQAMRAARLYGAAAAARVDLGIQLCPIDRDMSSRDIAVARTHLDEATFEAAWAEGRAMTLTQAVAYALREAQATGAGSLDRQR